MTTFKANFQRTGSHSMAGIRQLKGVKWSAKKNALKKLVIADGVLYFFSRQYLYAVDAQSGQELWKEHIELIRLDGLTYYEGVIYLTSVDPIYFVEFLCAIDVRTKQQKWRLQIGTAIGIARNIDSVIVNGVVCVTDRDGHVYGIEQETGQILWTFSTAEIVEMSPLALAGNTVYVGDRRGNLYAINSRTGHQQWRCELGLFGANSIPIVIDDMIYITAARGILYAVDVETGQKKWQFQLKENVEAASISIAESVAYIGSSTGYLCAIDLRAQQELWAKLQPKKYMLIDNIAVTNDVIYCSCLGAVYGLDYQTGQELWKFTEPLSDAWFLQPNLWWFALIKNIKKLITGTTFATFSYPIVTDGVIYSHPK